MIEINGQKYYTKNDILEFEENNKEAIASLKTVVDNLKKDPYYYTYIDFTQDNVNINDRMVEKDNSLFQISCNGRNDLPMLATYNGIHYLRVFNRFSLAKIDSSITIKCIIVTFRTEEMATLVREYIDNTGTYYRGEYNNETVSQNGRTLTITADNYELPLFGNKRCPIQPPEDGGKSLMIEKVEIDY